MVPSDLYASGTKLTVGSHEIEIIKYISQGGFALVYTCYITPSYNGSNIACLKRVVVPSKWQLTLLRQEVDAMRRLRGNKHIVSYIDSHAARLTTKNADSNATQQQYEVFLLMEYCENKGLIDLMNTRLVHKLTEPEILQIMYQTTLGVAMCHHLQPPLIHRDIKIENVLIDRYNTYKLADFGSSVPYLPPPKDPQEMQKLREDLMQHTTPQYRAPEMIDVTKGFAIDDKSDVWALGVFLYKLCYYTTPFESQNFHEMENAILHSSQTLRFKDQPGSMFSHRLKNIIKCCLREDPRRRPNATQLLEEIVNMMGLPMPNVIPYSVQLDRHTYNTTKQIQAQNRLTSSKSETFLPEKPDPFESIDKSKILDKNVNKLSVNKSHPRPITTGPIDHSNNLQHNYASKSMTSLKDSLKDYVQKEVEKSEESMARNSRKSEDRDDTLEFLKSKQEQNNTGGSIKLSFQKHLRRISTGGSSIHSISANNTGNNQSYNKKRSSMSSIKRILTGGRKPSDGSVADERFKGQYNDSRNLSDTVKTMHKRNEEKRDNTDRKSIASRMQALLKDSESVPTSRTAQGYGKFTDLDDLRCINQVSPSNESLHLQKPKHTKKLVPPKIPLSLSSHSSLKLEAPFKTVNSKLSKSPEPVPKQSKSPIQMKNSVHNDTEARHGKKPPPKPRKPTYLKSPEKKQYERRLSDSSELSIPDLDDLEKQFNKRFPSCA